MSWNTVEIETASAARSQILIRQLFSLTSQGVVTYASPVKAFATRIKMESSNLHSFWSRSRDQDECWV